MMTGVPIDELISAYLDDELDADARAQVEQALRDDVQLRRMYDQFVALRTTLQAMPIAQPDGDASESVMRQTEREMLGSPAHAAAVQHGVSDVTSPVTQPRPFSSWRVRIAAVTAAAALVLVALTLPSLWKQVASAPDSSLATDRTRVAQSGAASDAEERAPMLGTPAEPETEAAGGPAGELREATADDNTATDMPAAGGSSAVPEMPASQLGRAGRDAAGDELTSGARGEGMRQPAEKQKTLATPPPPVPAMNAAQPPPRRHRWSVPSTVPTPSKGLGTRPELDQHDTLGDAMGGGMRGAMGGGMGGGGWGSAHPASKPTADSTTSQRGTSANEPDNQPKKFESYRYSTSRFAGLLLQTKPNRQLAVRAVIRPAPKAKADLYYKTNKDGLERLLRRDYLEAQSDADFKRVLAKDPLVSQLVLSPVAVKQHGNQQVAFSVRGARSKVIELFDRLDQRPDVALSVVSQADIMRSYGLPVAGKSAGQLIQPTQDTSAADKTGTSKDLQQAKAGPASRGKRVASPAGRKGTAERLGSSTDRKAIAARNEPVAGDATPVTAYLIVDFAKPEDTSQPAQASK